MKIGLVCPYDFFRHGAVQKLVMVLDGELTRRGHDVRIITPRPRNYKGKVPKRMIFVGQSAKWVTPLKTINEVGISLEGDGMDEMFEEEKFDLLHVHEPEIPVLGAQIAARANCPIIATFHATMPDTTMSKLIELLRIPYARSIFKKIAYMTAVSDTAARFVREWSEIPVEIVPNYVDIKNFSPPKDTKRDPSMILYIGRLEKRKGVMSLLKAFDLLAARNPEVKLVVAGDGAERRRLETYVDDNNIPRVTFLGAVDDPTRLILLHQASLFCSPALYGESFGIVLLEAMAAQVPIVAGDNAGYACVMKDRGLLSLVNTLDTPEFARRLEILLSDKGLRDLWLKWANQEIKQYDFVKVIDQYEEIYAKALSAKQKVRHT